MRKNQKYTQDEMYLAIDMWKESGLSQNRYCLQNKLSSNTFKYWLKKYKKDKLANSAQLPDSFIPIEVPAQASGHITRQKEGDITISYPNGKVHCPISIGIQQLKALINT